MVVPDAATVLGPTAAGEGLDLDGIQQLAASEYKRGVSEAMPRDFVTMYHPDGTSSVVQLPPLGKSGQGIHDRQQKIIHYIANKRKNGQQWWFASPPEGWKPAELPYRCPVEGCTRAGGMPDLLNLWRHIQQKHPGEVPLYGGVIKAIQEKLESQVPADLSKLLAIDSQPITTTIVCEQCGNTPPEDHDNPVGWLRGHQMGAHKEAANAD